MSDKKRSQLLESFEDSALALLMDDYGTELGDQLWKEFEAARQDGTALDMPAALDQKCQALIHQSLHRPLQSSFKKHIKKGLRAAAIFTVVFLSVSSVLVFSVDAFRIPFLNFLVEHSNRSTTIVNNETLLTGTDQAIPIEERIPSGYTAIDDYSDGQGYEFHCFSDAENHIIQITKSPISATYDFDTEDAVQSYSTVINGYDGFFIEKSGYRVILYHTGEGVIYDIQADGLTPDAFWELVYRFAS